MLMPTLSQTLSYLRYRYHSLFNDSCESYVYAFIIMNFFFLLIFAPKGENNSLCLFLQNWTILLPKFIIDFIFSLYNVHKKMIQAN